MASHHVRAFQVSQGLPNVPTLQAELQDYTDVLLGRVTPPINKGVQTLAEVANAYYARAREIEMQIYKHERDNPAVKGTPLSKFRTSELRSFIEMAKLAYELGSRRITVAQWDHESGMG